ncbi:outer membrane protein OmpA-like peptidoglycan-associated protein [Lewinella marina]|uniref:OmpA-like domain-containing protein n=1 Tax=Neolewinella marina TaxID=438751 RepID=A0A2G0CHR0_9BACT|nr:OmpA family protein [Neolewinella marina]NJB85359.1 outer membrane protein OmpA-like peptidoglycan-associated protein [Neolewinella marina]PHK99525.1 hypothetical protein CGL56_00260 [Neolewinella marina]
MKFIPSLLLFFLAFTACVPKSQFDALVVERNFYHNQAMEADSLANARRRAETDSLNQLTFARQQQLREIENLKATNRSLAEQVTDLRGRYEALVAQNREQVATGGSQAMLLQQQLTERQAELNRRESALRQAELNLQAREQRMSSIDEMRSTQPGPATYGSGTNPQGTTPTDAAAPSTVTAGILYDELKQLLLAITDSGYTIERPAPNRLHLVMGGDLLFSDSTTVSLPGQRLLRRLGGTLRNYPQARYTIVGHAGEGGDATPLAAYDGSARRAARVAVQLAQFGVDPGRVVAGGKGFYGSEGGAAFSGEGGKRRVEIEITFPD